MWKNGSPAAVEIRKAGVDLEWRGVEQITFAGRDGGVTVNGAKVEQTDSAASSGLFGVIDAVLTPGLAAEQ
ncbi:hypothetical protein BH23PSE1_BH23PSE1_11190 [soil metagenome]